MSFDEKCLWLARAFLEGEPSLPDKNAEDLAQAIQDAIEDWFLQQSFVKQPR